MTPIDALLALLTFAVVVLLAEVARLRRVLPLVADSLQELDRRTKNLDKRQHGLAEILREMLENITKKKEETE